MRHLPVALAALALPVLAQATWQQCLPEGIRKENRTFLHINGTATPLIWVADAIPISNRIVGQVFAYIMEEVYGIHTARGKRSTGDNYYGLMGCSCRYCVVPKCSGPPWAHVVVGMTTQYWEARIFAEKHQPKRLPEFLGDIGHDSGPATLITGATHEAGLAVGLPLAYYETYNLTNDVTPFFSNVSEVPHSLLLPCNASVGLRGNHYKVYLENLGDAEGVTVGGKHGYEARCHLDGHWWLAPRCRRDPQRCVPVLSYAQGLTFNRIMTQATLFNLPWAVASPYRYPEWSVLPLNFRVIWSVQTPEHGFDSVRPKELLYPKYSEADAVKGNVQSYATHRMEHFFYNGWAGAIEERIAVLRAKEVLRRMSWSLEMVEEVSRWRTEIWEAMGRPRDIQPTYEEAACRFFRERESTWRAWLPKASECPLGQGMRSGGSVAGGGAAFVVERASAESCEWCSVGRYSAPLWDAEGLTHVCLPCPAGEEQRTSGEPGCTLCLPGRFKSTEGEALCEDCPAGSATELPGQRSCPACQPGRAAPEVAQLSCQACSAGTSAPEEGSLSCAFCERGSFANATGSRGCTSCDEVVVGSTSDRGAMQEGDCACPAQSYMLPGRGCVACAEGLECPGGNGEPLQAAGYWVDIGGSRRLNRDYTVYLCRDNQECPAGVLGTCASGRQDTACNNCKDFHYPTSNGRCEPCESTSVLPLVAFALLVVAAVSLFIVFTKVDATKQHLSLLITVVIAGQILTTIQALSAMKQIQIPWPGQLRALLEVLGLFVFDLEVLRLPCILTDDNPVSKFALKLLAYPAFVLVLLCVYAVSRLFRRPIEKVAIVNANGTLLLAIYISLTLSVALPFQCHANPSGFLSMATQPGVRCFQDPTHTSLAVLASLGILCYPVGIAAYVAHATVKIRAKARTVAGVQVAKRFQFIFARYKPERYHFGLVFLVRNCLVALVPVLFVATPVLQINVIAFVLLSGLVLQVRFQPWRTPLPNGTDSLLGMVLVLVITGVAALMDNTSQGVSTVIGVAMTASVALCLVMVLLLLFWALYRHLRPLKQYGIFLCHHKAAAGNLCRLLKIVLAAKTSHTVFIDSDHLDDLDQLFETVRSHVENLVVVLTQQVLARPWCAGEIVTAHRNGLNIVPLTCNDFDPDREHALVHGWSEQEVSLLGQYGISLDMVEEAYAALLQQEALQLWRQLPLPRKEAAMVDLVARCKLPITSGGALLKVQRQLSVSSKAPAAKSAAAGRAEVAQGQDSQVLVLGLVSDCEVLSACEVAQLELQQELEVGVAVVVDQEQLLQQLPKADVLIVLWSRGILEDAAFARQLLVAQEADMLSCALTALADPGFQFPGPDFLEDVARGEAVPGLAPGEGPALAQAYRALLKLLSRPFEPQRSQAAMAEQVRELAGRARPLLNRTRKQISRTSTWGQGIRAATLNPTPFKVAPVEEPLEEEPPEQPQETAGRDWL